MLTRRRQPRRIPGRRRVPCDALIINQVAIKRGPVLKNIIIDGEGRECVNDQGFREGEAPRDVRAAHRQGDRGPPRCTPLPSQDRTVRVVHNSYNHLEIKFDHAFDPDQDQSDIYGHFNNIIPRILDGYNLTIFAYGQTGSGKTHTMFGKSEGVEKGDQVDLSSSSRGIIPRAI